MQEKTRPFTAELVLGQRIEAARKACGLSRRELARIIRETEQQIAKYEAGAFVPLPKIEAIGEAVGDRVEKRTIRRISNLRKLEMEKGAEQHELCDLYAELFRDAGR